MKKLLCAALCVALIGTLAACAGPKPTPATTATTTTTGTTITTSKATKPSATTKKTAAKKTTAVKKTTTTTVSTTTTTKITTEKQMGLTETAWTLATADGDYVLDLAAKTLTGEEAEAVSYQVDGFRITVTLADGGRFVLERTDNRTLTVLENDSTLAFPQNAAFTWQ